MNSAAPRLDGSWNWSKVIERMRLRIVDGVEFLLRESGEEGADDMVDLRGHEGAVFRGNG